MNKKWYVLRVQVGRESRIRDGLQKRVKENGLEEQITRVVVPTEKVTEIRGGKKSVREKKLYPGYIMVEMDMTDDTWFAVREVPGIGDFLGLTQPIAMPEHEVEKMLAEKDVADKPKIKIGFQKGDNVRIKEGPFENFDGVVDDVNTTKGQVNVNITIFGRPTNVELEYWQLEKV